MMKTVRRAARSAPLFFAETAMRLLPFAINSPIINLENVGRTAQSAPLFFAETAVRATYSVFEL